MNPDRILPALYKRISRHTAILMIALIAQGGIVASLSLYPERALAATLLSDNFTGTTINTTKWTEIDESGAGGTAGNVQQNGSLTIANSFVSSVWGKTALVSANTYSSDPLEISAVMTRGSDQLIGYGDYNFQSAGTEAYLVDLLSNAVYALHWSNGSLAHSNTSCGTYTAGATYKMSVTGTGFSVYKNGTRLCSLLTSTDFTDQPVFFQSSATASTFDDVLITGTSDPTAPDAPTGVSATKGDEQATVSFSAPNNNGGSEILYYTVTSSPGSLTATGATSPITVTGLTNGVSYTFTVTATNSIGTSSGSTASSAVTPSEPTAPDAPTGASATAGSQQATVTFSAPDDDGGSDILYYTVTSSSGSLTATGATSPITVTGLTNGVSYTFTVTATNAIGTSSGSTASNSITPNTPQVLLTDSFTGSTIDTDKWTVVDAAGTNITQDDELSVSNSFGSEWGDTAIYSNTSFSKNNLSISAVITKDDATVLGYGDYDFDEPDTEAYLIDLAGAGSLYALYWNDGTLDEQNLSCGTYTAAATYTITVTGTGFNVYKDTGDGDVYQCGLTTAGTLTNKPVFMQEDNGPATFDDLVVMGTVTAPTAPTTVTATAGNGQATVTFSGAGNGGSDILYYTVTSSPGSLTATGATSPITVTGLTNGVSYTFTVTATNSVGTSSASDASNAVTPNEPQPPDQVTGLVATGMNKQVLLGWYEPDDNDYAITDYLIEYKEDTTDTWKTFADGTSTGTKVIVSGLTNGTDYDFRVSAVNEAGTGSASTTASATADEITELAFVFNGESNSGGIGLNSDATADELAERSSVQIMNLTSGDFLFEDLDIGTNNLRDHAGLSSYYDNSHGFELQLANSVEAHAFPDFDQVYLVKTGQGGSTISQWGVDDTYWTKYLERTAAAKTQLDDPTWVVWLSLGINDYLAGTTTSTFKSGLVDHINNIKDDLPGAIIVLTGFEAMGYTDYTNVLKEVAREEPNVFIVDSTGAAKRDSNHWSYAGLKTVGALLVNVSRDNLGLIYPSAPLSASGSSGNNQLSLSWQEPAGDGGSSVSDYVIQYKASGASAYTTYADDVTTSTSATLTGLEGDTTYNLRIAAINENGTGSFALFNAGTNDNVAPAVSSVVASSHASGALITWLTAESGSTLIEYGPTGDFGYTTQEADTSPRVLSHSAALQGLLPCTTYHYRVKSTDSMSNTGIGSRGTFTTAGCTGSATVHSQTGTLVGAASGATLRLGSSTGITLVIPAGFSDNDASFQIQALSRAEVLGTTSNPPDSTLVGGHIYELRAVSGATVAVTSFSDAISLTMTYSASDVSSFDESSLRIWRWDGAAWNELSGCTVDTSARTVTCTTTHFSTFGLFGTGSSGSSSSSSASNSGSGGGGGSGGRRGHMQTPPLPPRYAPDADSGASHTPADTLSPAHRLLLHVRERLLARIEQRIKEHPSVRSLLMRVLERLEERIEARLR